MARTFRIKIFSKIFLGLWGVFFLGFPSSSSQEIAFEKARPDYSLKFPRDHGIHPQYRGEWWYFTGHLTSSEGRRFGFQWTVFRVGLTPKLNSSTQVRSPWRTQSLYMGHVAISDLDQKKFYFGESLARESLGLAGGSAEDFKVWLPGFSGANQNGAWRLQANRGVLQLELNLELPEQPLLHGESGYSPKAFQDGYASHYYSYPRMATTGTIQLGDRSYSVRGHAWMDHEFASSKLAKTQVGWDWFALPLNQSETLMVFRVRDERGEDWDYYSGTYVDAQGVVHSLFGKEIQLIPQATWTSSKSKARYPIQWQVRIPKHQIQLEIKADFPEQELRTVKSTQVTYWEGSVSIRGSRGQDKIQSQGYLEMTGYDERFKGQI